MKRNLSLKIGERGFVIHEDAGREGWYGAMFAFSTAEEVAAWVLRYLTEPEQPTTAEKK